MWYKHCLCSVAFISLKAGESKQPPDAQSEEGRADLLHLFLLPVLASTISMPYSAADMFRSIVHFSI